MRDALQLVVFPQFPFISTPRTLYHNTLTEFLIELGIYWFILSVPFNLRRSFQYYTLWTKIAIKTISTPFHLQRNENRTFVAVKHVQLVYFVIWTNWRRTFTQFGIHTHEQICIYKDIDIYIFFCWLNQWPEWK